MIPKSTYSMVKIIVLRSRFAIWHVQFVAVLLVDSSYIGIVFTDNVGYRCNERAGSVLNMDEQRRFWNMTAV